MKTESAFRQEANGTIKVKNLGQKNHLVRRSSWVERSLFRLMTSLTCTYKFLLLMFSLHSVLADFDTHMRLLFEMQRNHSLQECLQASWQIHHCLSIQGGFGNKSESFHSSITALMLLLSCPRSMPDTGYWVTSWPRHTEYCSPREWIHQLQSQELGAELLMEIVVFTILHKAT